MFTAKDFIETAEGLIFAVVWHGTESKRVLCFLRYVREEGVCRKASTEQANSLLRQKYPDYLYHSSVLDADLHAVPLDKIVKHYQPRSRLREVMRGGELDPIERDLFHLCALFEKQKLDLAQVGVTGSLLIGCQTPASDIDLVIYNRNDFHRTRDITRRLMEQGALDPLSEEDWLESYRRRSCELSLEEYIWHEKRKYNKGMVNGRKFDLGMIIQEDTAEKTLCRKHGAVRLQARVTDDEYAFDYPAVFKIDSDWADEVVCFSATYTGQAFAGEKVDVSGLMEQSEAGVNRIIVGSSREAAGEYIKVVRE
ncbi:MAG: nucleotidyltransferase domain-containing protein [Gammaproteobacteria bacterium]